MSATLSIEQLLRAAQILEENALQLQLIRQQQQQQQQQQQHHQQQQIETAFLKLGEGYQNRMTLPKMRAPGPVESATAGGSTGSSRRSTPSGGMFYSTPCSAPSSPSNGSVFSTVPLAATVIPDVVPSATDASTSSAFSPVAASGGANIAHNSPPSSSSSVMSMSVRQNRAAHNELEKNRRANLRGYLDQLKCALPADVDATRDTTLSLLTRARNHLRTMKAEKYALTEARKAAITETLRLRAELDRQQQQLSEQNQLTQQQQLAEQVQLASSSVEPTVQPVQSVQPIQTSQLAPTSMTVPTFALPALPASALAAWWTATQQQQQQQSLEQQRKTVDLYMDGLLPALPLLYPYNELVRRHAATATR